MGFGVTMSRGLSTACAVGAVMLLSVSATFAGAGPFEGLAGIWTGRGTIQLEDGSSENIRCKATYAVRGDAQGLNQTLLCASDSYRFELKSNVIAQSGVLSGTWRETSRNVGGTLEGRAGNGQFNVDVSAPSFTARLKLTTHGNRQNVVIRSEGQFRGANISLSRS
ncbi:MAG: hypothetical protein NTAFB05_11910 [Nitrobacter sp.]|uniref:hypothetical protein n=1 Tax=Nitrobacter sp. TaxID=29420 RepID=UPI00387DD6C8